MKEMDQTWKEIKQHENRWNRRGDGTDMTRIETDLERDKTNME